MRSKAVWIFVLVVVSIAAVWLLRSREATVADATVITVAEQGAVSGHSDTQAPSGDMGVADATAKADSSQAARAVASSSQTSSAQIASNAPASTTSLPILGLPLRDSAPALLAAHRSGNIEATRRLMGELGDCMRYRRSSLSMDMAIAMQDSPPGDAERGRNRGGGGERMARWLADTAETVAGLRESCEGLPDDFDQEVLFEVQRRAADAGDLEGLLGFALVPAISMNKALVQMDRLEIYREFAPQFLQRALEQGSGQAVAGFMQAHEHFFEGWRGRAAQGTAMQTQAMRRMMDSMNPQTPIQQVLGEDLALAYGYALLCKRVCNAQDRTLADATILRLESALEPPQRSASRDRSNTLYERYFAAKPRPEDIDLAELREAIIGFGRGQ